MTPFNSHDILIQKLNISHNEKNQLQAYLIGFDIDNDANKVYRWNPFINIMCNAIPEFAYGFHQGQQTENTDIFQKLQESADAIYSINDFQKIQEIYEENPLVTDDELENLLAQKYTKRGEFGELILHIILRDRFQTIPLISKIYFKDSYGVAAHGFDCIHINEQSEKLFLGESKLYQDPKKGISELIKDLDEHFNIDFFNSEFSILRKRLSDHKNLEEREKWIKLLSNGLPLQDKLQKIVIPLICTYSCDLFTKYSDIDDSNFIKEYTDKINTLYEYFLDRYEHKWNEHLEIVLILFPVQNKNELVIKMHRKLKQLQDLGK